MSMQLCFAQLVFPYNSMLSRCLSNAFPLSIPSREPHLRSQQNATRRDQCLATGCIPKPVAIAQGTGSEQRAASSAVKRNLRSDVASVPSIQVFRSFLQRKANVGHSADWVSWIIPRLNRPLGYQLDHHSPWLVNLRWVHLQELHRRRRRRRRRRRPLLLKPLPSDSCA